MRLKTMTAMVCALAALVMTACASTNKPYTPMQVIEQATLPPVPSELMLLHPRPSMPMTGTSEVLLNHAVQYGVWASKLELQVQAWQQWYKQGVTDGHH